MNEKRCPLCGSEECTIEDGINFVKIIRCKSLDIVVRIVDDVFDDFKGSALSHVLNIVVEFILRKRTGPDKKWWTFYYDEAEEQSSKDGSYINLAPIMRNYPISVIEKADRVLLNLAWMYKCYGVSFCIESDECRLYLPEDYMNYDECEGMIRILMDLGYVKEGNTRYTYVITVEGWKHIEDLKKQNVESKQAFIAMSFCDETKTIREGFRQAITEVGYNTVIIDEKEHNNQIVPEILYEIERSKFVVVDVTYPNYGAYYEAGFAQGLGKQVIVCCKRDVFENKDGIYIRPHFDISQKSMVIWDNIEELVIRLKRRIAATVR